MHCYSRLIEKLLKYLLIGYLCLFDKSIHSIHRYYQSSIINPLRDNQSILFSTISCLYFSVSVFQSIATETRKEAIVVDPVSILFFHLFSSLLHLLPYSLSPRNILHPRRPSYDRSFIHLLGWRSFIHSFNTFVPRGDTGLVSQHYASGNLFNCFV